MEKNLFSVLFLIVASAYLVMAADYSGDGVYIVREGDIITLDNGWRVEILGIVFGSSSEQITFRAYDLEGNAYPEPPY